jgi:hypothetical protein
MSVQSSEGSNDSHPAETEKSVDALEYSVVDCEGSLNPMQYGVNGKPSYGSYGVISFPKKDNHFINPPAATEPEPVQSSIRLRESHPQTFAFQRISFNGASTWKRRLHRRCNAICSTECGGKTFWVTHRLCGVGQKLNSKDAATSD